MSLLKKAKRRKAQTSLYSLTILIRQELPTDRQEKMRRLQAARKKQSRLMQTNLLLRNLSPGILKTIPVTRILLLSKSLQEQMLLARRSSLL